MIDQSALLIARITAFASLLITVLVVTVGLNEPVNSTKMFALSGFGFVLLGLYLVPFIKDTFKDTRVLPVQFTGLLAALFVTQLLISNVLSSQPFEHGLFGTYGRNTGSLTYISLCSFMLACVIISKNQLTQKITDSLYYAGLLNLGYFALTLVGIEIFNWNNPSKSVLGTFGNSNFAGAFMGIFFVNFLVRVIQTKKTVLNSFANSIIAIFTIYEILKTKATQGIIVSGLGIVVLGFFWIRSRYSQKLVLMYVFLVSTIGAFAVGGMLQIGPFTQYLYKVSVSLRGGYWNSGIQMGLDHPFFGVGPDSYGFYYRQYRGQQIMDLAGPTTTTDAAHNVFIDIFAYGGFPLIIFYLAFQAIALYVIYREVKSSKKFDPIFAGLVASWLAYHAQSLVSINQIGVAIWGWIFTGLIVGRAHLAHKILSQSTTSPSIKKSTKRRIDGEKISAREVISGVILGSIGIGLAIQPLISDATYFSSLKKKEIGSIEIAAKKWPTNPVRLGDASTIFANNGFQKQALDMAKFGIDKYPDSYVSWFVYYGTPSLSEAEKAKALKVLQKLDPLNQDLKN